MKQSNLLTGKFIYLGFFAILLSGCDDGSSPTSTNKNELVGVWIGNSTFTSAAPNSNPVAQALSSSIGKSQAISANCSAGEQTTCRVTYTEDGNFEDFSGGFSGTVFSLNGTYSSSAIITGINVGGVLYDARENTSSFTGKVSENSITGTIGNSYNLTASANGQAAGIINTVETISLHR